MHLGKFRIWWARRIVLALEATPGSFLTPVQAVLMSLVLKRNDGAQGVSARPLHEVNEGTDGDE
jgi:hypothetical protein